MSSKVFTWGVTGAVAAMLMASPGLTQNADEEIPAVGSVDNEVAAPAVVEAPVEMPAEAPATPAQPEPVSADEDLFAPIVVPPAAQPTAPVANILPAPQPEAPAPAPEAVEPVAEPPTQAQPLTPEQEAEAARRLAEQTVVRLREQEIRGKKALTNAQMAMTRRQYKEAMALFQKALEALPVRPQNEADRAEANRGLSEAQFQVIQELIRADQLQEALDLAMAANKRDPGHRGIERQLSAIQEELKRQKEREEQEAARVARDVTRSPEIQKRREEVNRLIREGRGFLAIGDTKRAADRFTSALSIDPENKEALRYLERAGEQAMKIRTVERSATSAQMLADVRGAWNPGDYTYVAPPPPPPAERGEGQASALIEKMEKIIIPQIEFRQANINDVVDFLVKASIAEDTTTDDPAKKGVNIILNLGPGTAGPAAAPAMVPTDLFGVGGGAPAAPMALGVPEITFSARFISLYSALKIITSVANLKFRIENQIVMIVPSDAPDGVIETKWYSVQPGFLDKIRGMATAPEGGAGTDLWGGGGLEARAAPPGGDVETFFRKMGVEFPKGASIVFQPALSKLVVANTAPNHEKIERILREIDVPPKQVEIEARFVEVNQTDLEELGFEWLLTDNWQVLQKKGGGLLGGRERIEVARNSDTMGFTRGLRFMNMEGADLIPSAGGSLGAIMRVQSVLTNPELAVILHMLEQSGRADVLSAPKVTTKSGNEANIRVVTEYIYPTEFDIRAASELMGDTGTTDNQTVEAKVVALPQNFETREVGVILSVVPQVSEEGNIIDLNMRPEVVSEPTWYEYGVTLPDAQGNEYQVRMPQPFFHRRSVETQISIYDGATVVMGGLITEKIIAVNDKIPFLGDLPLIGFLFRNKGQQSQKRNLLIFVTARLVDPAGKPIRSTTPGQSGTVETSGATSEKR